MEEQGLADRRLHRFRLERFGDQEGRLGPFAGQQPLREGGDEDDRHVDLFQNLLHRVDPRRPVGQLDVGQHQTGAMMGDGRDGLGVGGGGAGHPMAQFLHQALDIGRDDGLVLYDQDVGRQFGVDIRLGVRDQPVDVTGIGVKDLGGLGRGKALQGGQQEGLARTWRDPHHAARCIVLAAPDAAHVFQPGTGRGPDGVKDMVESHARRHLGRKLELTGREGFESDTDIVVTGGLIAGQGAGIATDVRKMRRKAGQQTHVSRSPTEATPRGKRRLPQRIGSATVPLRHAGFDIYRHFHRNPAGKRAFRQSQQPSPG